ncbi:MAG TPA: CooT family nickel-binding protein [Candidatus Latescibacteria bacterium]|nr:CooT family nickel-binding protein [Candidatus Latescibacterota bacterium]
MCMAKVYLEGEDEEELVLEEVATLRVDGDRLLLETIFGEQKSLAARIERIDFLNSRIVLSQPFG